MLALLVLFACSSDIDCADPAAPVVDGPEPLTCSAASAPIHYLDLLAARSMPKGDRQLILKHVRSAWRSDPAATRAWLAEIRAAGAELEVLWGLPGAERRATRVWEAANGRGVIDEDDGGTWSVQSRALAVWSEDEGDKLALTEADIEGWILYGSLCREVQGGGVLRLSVADRVTVYRMIQERFDDATREERIALAAMGPYWRAVKDAWAVATYEQQQGWIAAAPLPPPMTATSLGYIGALIDGRVAGHAEQLHGHLGPLPLTRERRFEVTP